MVERFEGKGIWHYLDRVWIVMNSCIKRGLAAEGELPGGLGIMRKAHMLNNRRHMDESPETRENRLVCAYAHAVSEENASCGEIVTARPVVRAEFCPQFCDTRRTGAVLRK